MYRDIFQYTNLDLFYCFVEKNELKFYFENSGYTFMFSQSIGSKYVECTNYYNRSDKMVFTIDIFEMLHRSIFTIFDNRDISDLYKIKNFYSRSNGARLLGFSSSMIETTKLFGRLLFKRNPSQIVITEIFGVRLGFDILGNIRWMIKNNEEVEIKNKHNILEKDKRQVCLEIMSALFESGVAVEEKYEKDELFISTSLDYFEKKICV
jgi:hypothetical protein